jgi:hypothetical protein
LTSINAQPRRVVLDLIWKGLQPRLQRKANMTRNVGNTDKGLRIAAGVVLLALGLFGPLGWWGLVGVVPLATGLLGSCPVYSLIGLNTCPLGPGKA